MSLFSKLTIIFLGIVRRFVALILNAAVLPVFLIVYLGFALEFFNQKSKSFHAVGREGEVVFMLLLSRVDYRATM